MCLIVYIAHTILTLFTEFVLSCSLGIRGTMRRSNLIWNQFVEVDGSEEISNVKLFSFSNSTE